MWSFHHSPRCEDTTSPRGEGLAFLTEVKFNWCTFQSYLPNSYSFIIIALS